MLTFNCSRCGGGLRLAEEFAGGKARCPGCGGVIDVPGLPEPASAASPGPRREARSPVPGDAADLPTVLPRPGEAVPDPEGVLAPPQGPGELGRLGPYRVLGVLGGGAMGVVYHAEDEQLRRPLALKALRPALAASAGARERFLREARAAAAVKNDHVVTIYQVGEDRGIPYLAMQLLHGESLEACLRRRRRLPPGEVLRVGRDIAEGLAAAHARGVIHRDIKPANVWLEARPGEPGASATGGRVKILDFGLARAATEDARLTRSGAVVGTPGYLAPEQAQGRSVDERSDLFSLGCVLYRCCTGEPPFRGPNTLAILTALAVETPRPVRELNPAVPPGLSDLVRRLLAKDPAGRPPSARAVIHDLAAIPDHGPEPPARPGDAANGSAPSSHDTLVDRPVVRRPVAWLAVLIAGGMALLGLFALCLAGAGWLALRGGLFADNPAPLPARPPPAHWTVLFRADDPSLWNTDSRRGDQFAVPLSRAPAALRYVRLRRLDTGEALILPLTADRLGTVPQPVPDHGYAWNGSAQEDWGGRHLGIAQAPRYPFAAPQGIIVVAYENWDAFRGSGFGHKCFVNDTQYYCWRGDEIPRTIFEIAVTNDPLTDDERRCLLPDR
jgi:serine/threonine protein kinase